MPRLLRRLGRIALWMLAAVLVLIVGFVALNAIDSPLDPDALAARNRQPEAVAPADNLLHVVYGFNIDQPANSAADLARLGEPIIAHLREMESSGRNPVDDANAGPKKIPSPALQQMYSAWNSGWSHSCLDDVRQQREAIASLIRDNAELIRRFRMLREVPRDVFDLPRNPAFGLPEFGAVMSSHRLLLAQISLQALDHDPHTVEELVADLKFWRHDLAERPSLIGKMLATAGLGQALTVVGDLLRSDLLKQEQIEQLRGGLAPLTSEERTLGPVFDEEFLFHQDAFDRARSADELGSFLIEEPWSIGSKVWSRITGFFFLRNATINRDFRQMRELRSYDALPCSQQDWNASSLTGSELSFLDYARNPVGNVLVSISNPAYQDYTQRTCNLVGLMRIAGLQALIRQQRVGPENIAAFVAHAGTAYADPYTDQPMKWDPEHGLSFVPHGRDDRTQKLLPWPI